MNSRSKVIFGVLIVFALQINGWVDSTLAQPPKKQDGLDEINRATAGLNRNQTFHLKYQLNEGETLRYRTEHVLTTRTSKAKFEDKVSSRSQNFKVYRIQSVDSLGRMTFVHINEKSKTETRKNDEKPVIFNSESKQAPPDDYRTLAKTIGAVLFTYQIDPHGKILDRKSNFPEWDLSTGKAVIPFPQKPIPVGYTWYVKDLVTARRKDYRYEKIVLRLRYRLEEVKGGIAKISMKTEVLTPITAKLRSQILQDLIEGERYFDIPRGRLVRSEIRWNNRVLGFEGPDSLMEYLGRYSEQLVEGQSKKTVQKDPVRVVRQLEIRTVEGKPIMRRPKR